MNNQWTKTLFFTILSGLSFILTHWIYDQYQVTSSSNDKVAIGYIKEKEENVLRLGKFLNDPQITKDFINETCQRCSLSYEECVLRASPPSTYLKEKKSIEKNIALENLIKEFK